MGRIKKLLKDVYGYNLRERLNIYAGALLIVTIPITAIRYGIFDYIKDDSILASTSAWGLSVIVSLPISIPASFGGLSVGFLEANRLRGSRLRKESKLEKVVGE